MGWQLLNNKGMVADKQHICYWFDVRLAAVVLYLDKMPSSASPGCPASAKSSVVTSHLKLYRSASTYNVQTWAVRPVCVALLSLAAQMMIYLCFGCFKRPLRSYSHRASTKLRWGCDLCDVSHLHSFSSQILVKTCAELQCTCTNTRRSHRNERSRPH